MKLLLTLMTVIGGLSTWTQMQDRHSSIASTDVLLDTVDEDYIPTDLEDCFRQIDRLCHDSVKAKVRVLEENDFATRNHMSFGMWMRNNWGLWGGSRLAKWFNSIGIYHPDDMSGIILTSYHRYLNHREIDLDGQVKYYQAYWKKMEEMQNKE